jgi:hypothetical protein
MSNIVFGLIAGALIGAALTSLKHAYDIRKMIKAERKQEQ